MAEVDKGICEITLESWKDFGPEIVKHHTKNSTYFYRGQGDASWKIESRLDRHERDYPQTENQCGGVPEKFNCTPATRKVHLEAFKECVVGRRNDPLELNENEWWALAQHHGLATPLLDWTYSPFVALFFAFEEEAFCIGKELHKPEARAVYFTPFHFAAAYGTEEHPAPEVFSVRRELTPRIQSQTGVFMKMPKATDFESNIRGRFDKEPTHGYPALTKFVIPNTDRIECLKFLDKMNINRMTLFPDLDGAARYVNSLWELNFDTPLGRLPDSNEERS